MLYSKVSDSTISTIMSRVLNVMFNVNNFKRVIDKDIIDDYKKLGFKVDPRGEFDKLYIDKKNGNMLFSAKTKMSNDLAFMKTFKRVVGVDIYHEAVILPVPSGKFKLYIISAKTNRNVTKMILS